MMGVLQNEKNAVQNKDKKSWSHLLYVFVVPVYLIFFYIEEHLITDNYFVTYMKLDDYIPFNEWFLIPYYIWYPFMVGVGLYLIFKDADGFRRYMTMVGLSFFVAVIIFAIFPNGQDLRPTEFERDNILVDMIKGLYKADTNTNVCPSLHVVGTLAALFALIENKVTRRASVIIPASVISFFICISTVFIKQHSIVDVVVAIPYSVVIWFVVYRIIFKKRG